MSTARSPLVAIGTSSNGSPVLRCSSRAVWNACACAKAERRVAILNTTRYRLRLLERRVSLREVEQLAQRLGVRVVAPAVRDGLEPHGRLVQQPVDDALCQRL